MLSLLDGTNVAGALLILALVVAGGLGLGAVQVRGISLGVAGVLFAGILAGHLGAHVDERMLEFGREFGLVLFVFTVGMQVGPGFFSSLRRHGLALNGLCAGIVLLGVATTLLLRSVFDLDPAAAIGLMSGAVTNTPSLAAAQQALKETPGMAADAQTLTLPGLGYAVTYPFGVLGVILAMMAARIAFRIDVAKEREEQQSGPVQAGLERVNLEVTNPNLDGLPLSKVPLLGRAGLVVSRIHRAGTLQVPQPETELKLGDVLLAVGTPEELESLRVVVGRASGLDLRTLPSPITSRRLIVTRPEASGHSIDQLDAVHRFGVQVTRVGRAEVEMAPQPGLELQYGDTVLAVGEPAGLDKLATELGDSPKKLDYPHLAPMFLGIALGVALGQWPMHLPGLPAPVKLGLAGGPLLVAMALSRIGRMGPLVWYMPISANYMLRQVGIVLFLAAVGLKAGGHFVETLVAGPGLTWLFCGSAITLVPLLLAAAIGRLVLKLNYLPLCGVLAGSMTDPPALSFATSLVGSEGPALAYATVYPLATILRVLLAQVLVRTLVG